MTRNEKMAYVAVKLGLKLHFDSKWQLYIHEITAYLDDFGTDTPAGHWLAHLLIERMVADGWRVNTYHKANGSTMAYAWTEIGNQWAQYETGYCLDFPAAVVELFCRVFDIKED